MSEIIGVDFGTSTSLVSTSAIRGARMLPLGDLNTWVPSIAGLSETRWLVGEEAANLPESSLVRSVKRAITENLTQLKITDGSHEVLVLADDVIRDILQMIAERVEYNALPITDGSATVRLGCPAMWSGQQRRRLIRLANEAGVPVHDTTLIDEPVAAGVAWVNRQLAMGNNISGKVLVYDMGGGTLDIAVLRVTAYQEAGDRGADIWVQAANGTDVAGDRIDRELREVLKARLIDIGFDASDLNHPSDLDDWLLRAAREAKVDLTKLQETSVSVAHPHVDVPLCTLFRTDVDQAIRPLLTTSMERVWEVARAALMSQTSSRFESVTLAPDQARGLSPDELASGIDHVLVAGGMARVPALREFLGEHFGHDRIHQVDDPEQLIAAGLGADDAYESLNLHRPGFDFVLTWLDTAGSRRELRVYEAYTPFYDRHQVLYTNSVAYQRWFGPGDDLPRHGEAMISARTVSGQTIPLEIDGVPSDGIPFKFGNGTDAMMSIEPNGRVFVRDAKGYSAEWFISRWPVIKGRGAEAVKISRTRETLPLREWYYDHSGD